MTGFTLTGISFPAGADVFTVTGFALLAPAAAEEPAVLTRIRLALTSEIGSLGLPLAGVYSQWTPDETNVRFPCVILTHENTTPQRVTKVMGTDDVGHPVRVLICDKQAKTDHRKMPKYDQWRQKIARRFSGKRLSGVNEAFICDVEDDVYATQETAKFETMVSQLVIRVWTREPAGYGA